MPRQSTFFAAIHILAVLAGLSSACGSGTAAEVQPIAMADLHAMPAEVQSAPATAQHAYRFAAANPGVMRQIPCYCGCGPLGHTSSYDCYWQAPAPDGTLAFEAHALGCKTCVDITTDTIRLTGEGQTPGQIKDYVDMAYGRYGPSNMP
jgi:hypothetical protein